MFALGGKTVAKASVLKVKVAARNSTKIVPSLGRRSYQVRQGCENGDYKCFELGCDSDIQIRLATTKFGTNSAGKAVDDNDVVGNAELEDTAAAWRHVTTSITSSNARSCCSTEVTNAPSPGETTVSFL